MTDDLAEAKRHIRALLEMSEDLFPGFIPGCGSYLAAEARKDDARREAQAFLNAEGQTVEGGDFDAALNKVIHERMPMLADAAQPEHDRTVRLAALEEAAKIADSTGSFWRGHPNGAHARAIAKAIRSLIDQTGGEGGI